MTTTSETAKPRSLLVSVYLVDKAYGGPEEGGWWYECGTPAIEPELIARTRGFLQGEDGQAEETASSYRHELQDWLDEHWNQGRPSIDSVTSTGQYLVVVDEDALPAPYPKERPRYE